MGEQAAAPETAMLMKILPHVTAQGSHSFTSRAGLMVAAVLLKRLGLAGMVDRLHREQTLAERMGIGPLPRSATLGSRLRMAACRRADASENRIKELRIDFAGTRLPGTGFRANAVYLALSAMPLPAVCSA
ncbi:MAG: hypothetical protein F4X92_10960 [Gammaproteobacteria bacterium]|nr:hypothetical protein [Gammaproteobacteria bacterium]